MRWGILLALTLPAATIQETSEADANLVEAMGELIDAGETGDADERVDRMVNACDNVVEAMDLEPERSGTISDAYERIEQAVERALDRGASDECRARASERLRHNQEVLQRVRARAPEAAHAGLDRAIEASGRGSDHAHGQGHDRPEHGDRGHGRDRDRDDDR